MNILDKIEPVFDIEGHLYLLFKDKTYELIINNDIEILNLYELDCNSNYKFTIIDDKHKYKQLNLIKNNTSLKIKLISNYIINKQNNFNVDFEEQQIISLYGENKFKGLNNMIKYYPEDLEYLDEYNFIEKNNDLISISDNEQKSNNSNDSIIVLTDSSTNSTNNSNRKNKLFFDKYINYDILGDKKFRRLHELYYDDIINTSSDSNKDLCANDYTPAEYDTYIYDNDENNSNLIFLCKNKVFSSVNKIFVYKNGIIKYKLENLEIKTFKLQINNFTISINQIK
jgi:hypothetical protein